MSACDALKARLVLATSHVCGTAGRTGLLSKGRAGLDHPSAAFLHLVGEDQVECAPALVEDGAVEARLLPDPAPRLFEGAAGRGRHGLDAQVLQYGDAEPLGDRARGPVVEVEADPPGAGLQAGHATALASIAPGTPLAVGEDALRPALRGLDPIQARGDGHHLARREGEGRCHATVDPNGGPNVLRSLVLDLAGKGDVPPVRSARDGGVLERAPDRARVTEFHPADLRQAHRAPFGVQAAGFDLASGKAKRVVDAFLARGWVARAPGEKVDERPVQVAQRLLLTGDVNGPDPVELGAEPGQFRRLLDVTEAMPSAPCRPLLQGKVVDEAAPARELPEQGLLFGGRTELEAVAAGDHSEALQVGLRSRNMDVRRGRHVVYALHAHLVFVTKYRRDVLPALAIRDLSGIFAKVCRDVEAELVECSGEDDHVHLLVRYSPKVALSK